MKNWRFSEAQKAELENAAKTCAKPRVRAKAIALSHMAHGRTAEQAAEAVFAHRASVAEWAKRYLQRGLEGLETAPGRGRRSKIDPEELELYLRQSPEAFGLGRTRWTLALLAQAAPCLKGMTGAGVLGVLRRLGYAYKRGQPHLHSPDPDYEAKKGLWTKP